MSTLFFAALLGVIQGLTEFLPVSSSGHLILARAVLGWDAEAFGLAFDVACHVGTLAALLVYFRRDLAAMAAALPRVAHPAADPAARRLWLVAAGTVPVVIVGSLLGGGAEGGLRMPAVAVSALAGVALVFFLVERIGRQRRGEESLSVAEAVLVGVAQAAALVPGVSRSGATISAGMVIGLRRADAARFGFLLGVPAIVAAAAKEGIEVARHGLGPGEAWLFAVGVATSAAVGYVTVKYFIRYLADHSLRPFAWYRLGIAAVVVAWWAVV